MVLAALICCLLCYGLKSYATAPDFSSAVDLEAKYRALLAAHEETVRTVDLLKSETQLGASKVDSSLISLQEDLQKMSVAVEQAELARAALVKAQDNMAAQVKKMQTDTTSASDSMKEKAEALRVKTEEHLSALKASLDVLMRDFEAIKLKDIGGELATLRSSVVQEAVAEVLKLVKSEEVRVSAGVEAASAAIVSAVRSVPLYKRCCRVPASPHGAKWEYVGWYLLARWTLS